MSVIRSTKLAGQVKDLDHAADEIRAARDELAALTPSMDEASRRRALVDPVARLRLALRFVSSVVRTCG